MLESLTLTNFRRHESIEVALSPGLNVLTGASKSGKSTLIRALRWVAFNRPAGDSVLRWGSEFARVKLSVDGHAVVRKRGPKTNIYKLDGASYKSFGQDVPDDVARLLNVSPTFNFSGQHSAPFLFSLTPGEAARELNAVVNLDRIDEILSNLAADVRKTKTAVSVSEERLKVAEDRARDLGWVEQVDKALSAVEEAEAAVIRLEQELASTERMVSRAVAASAGAAAAAAGCADLGRRMEEVDASISRVEDLVGQLRSASALVGSASRATLEWSRAKAVADEAEAEFAKLELGRCPVCGSARN